MQEVEHQWQCPQCKEPLALCSKKAREKAPAIWQCSNKHHFDVAKEGYVNLLLAQHKKSKAPGDNKEMVLARRAFLAEGHYLALASALAECLTQHLNNENERLALFDAGCGEGYYLAQLKSALAPYFAKLSIAGIDISKPAVQKAAKHNQNGHFAVASSYNLPLPSASQDAVIQIFAPSSDEEIKRVLQASGLWIQVNPAPNHLLALKQMIYDTPELHTINTEVNTGFSLISQKQITFDIQLSSEQTRENLLMMTPYYWTISQAKKDALIAGLAAVQAHFDIKVLQKL